MFLLPRSSGAAHKKEQLISRSHSNLTNNLRTQSSILAAKSLANLLVDLRTYRLGNCAFIQFPIIILNLWWWIYGLTYFSFFIFWLGLFICGTLSSDHWGLIAAPGLAECRHRWSLWASGRTLHHLGRPRRRRATSPSSGATAVQASIIWTRWATSCIAKIHLVLFQN